MKKLREMIIHRSCLFLLLLQIMVVSANTNSQDAASLYGLGSQWQNTPLNWNGVDPCGDSWVGISCNNSRIVSITLPSLGLKGTLSGDIQSMTELKTLDLSYNKGLTGQIPSSIGSLSKLENLILIGCSFSGEIPQEIGSLKKLVLLFLTSNKFSGRIPPTIGNLANLILLDVADNMLTGEIPVSGSKNPGLDMLIHTKHFHFGVNRLSGTIPEQLFSSNMQLIHVLFDNNNLSGEIPSTLGLVKTLEIVRLDRNKLTGNVPSNVNNLTSVLALHLSNNKLTGPLPNLTGMESLSYVDMSNNSFDATDVPTWFSTLPSLTTLMLEYLRIRGQIPTALFSFPPLETARLRNNKFNGTLNIGTEYSSQLELVDVQYNNIQYFTLGGGYKNQLKLAGNPFCEQSGSDEQYCQLSQQPIIPYSTPPQDNCIPISCPAEQSLSPHCFCAYPYSGTLVFWAPSFSALGNRTYFQILEGEILTLFQENQLPVDSVSLQNITTNLYNYLTMFLQVFPSGKLRFDQSDISSIGFILSNQTFKPTRMFGPYYFDGLQYEAFQGTPTGGKSNNNKTVIIGAAAGAAVLALLLIWLVVFTVQRKKKAKHVEERQPFESWVATKRSGNAPQLKGARNFSYDELRKCTNNFAEMNDIGTGGYGKVYKGTLANGQLVAIKRAQHGSMQGGLEFKTEIELLSRVHHKNLVSLVGFCFDQGEQMLVYEYVANGSLKESLTGKSGVRLDWKRRLRVALGAAKGLAYLHDLADPPIVHRDIKSSNILLDSHLNAKVSDFGLSKPLGDDGKDHVTTQVKGTMGYLDPEYYMSQQLTEKSDVYSFGILLLELITARKPIERGRYVVREVTNMMDKTKDLYGLDQLVDPIMLGSLLGGFQKFIDLALSCVQEEGAGRPRMSQVVKEIENIMILAAASLYGLGSQWQNTPLNWNGVDPCGDSWVGISCNNSRIVSITLPSLGLKGTLSGDIQSMTELKTLDLSYNKGLTGQLPSSIGSLSKLENLILIGCSFSGEIPQEIGSLKKLVLLFLTSNKFSGRIPPTIGNLANLILLDVADNMLTGEIPVSDSKNPGLDLLIHTKHFHFGVNRLSGTIPEQLFSSNMQLIHVLFDNNNLSGEIPSTLGLVKTLEIVRLDRNKLTGNVPSNVNNLTRVLALHLSNNKLTGPLPNLTGMKSLCYVDMSNNSFDATDVPTWFSTLPSLTTLMLEYLRIRGQIPTALFSFPPLQTARLRNNKFNGTLNIGTEYSSQLELVDVQYNNIQYFTLGGGYKNQLKLAGNPFCEQSGSDEQYCQLSQHTITPYSTAPQDNCIPISCPAEQSLSPHCFCAYPYSGTLVFWAPSFSALGNRTYFQILEGEILTLFQESQLPVDSVSLQNITTNLYNYLTMFLQVFPSGKLRFDQSDISSIGSTLSSKPFGRAELFGPYHFDGLQYAAFQETPTGGKSNNNK
ncbi:hypothetical protein J5N97_012666 [Dioscorea zingiberensis]|uniref:non-specific serine/threonine protein kinase n=1 Tax=Dioscorea zingiberensis TaxID=325984 RepID=A0A9D5HIB6_9LILI|nr:hypothetical protein J5N97_012666 [Dioscorea zingiberensis]